MSFRTFKFPFPQKLSLLTLHNGSYMTEFFVPGLNSSHPESRAVVAFSGKKILGWLSLEPDTAQRTVQFAVFVPRSLRRKGTGTALLHYATRLKRRLWKHYIIFTDPHDQCGEKLFAKIKSLDRENNEEFLRDIGEL